MALNRWDSENHPCQLPDDYRAFLQISDGLSLNWKIKRNDTSTPLGSMNLNKLREIKEIESEVFKFSRIGADDSDSDDEEYLMDK
jgi:hypothetical protein